MRENKAVAAARESINRYQNTIDRTEGKLARIEEAFQQQYGVGLDALRKEDIGWKPLGGTSGNNEGLAISDIKLHAESARTLRAANPIVRRGVLVRNSYIWADDISYPEGAQKFIDNPVNEEAFFSDEAREILESALCTDGQYFLLLNKAEGTIRRIPFNEITGYITHPEFKSDVLYYKRTYTIETTKDDGTVDAVERNVYIPSVRHDGRGIPATIAGLTVEQGLRVEHATVNKQDGWVMGLPDLLGAVFWAKAYKEYLEASYTLARALAKIAFKVTSQSGKGQKQVAAKMATPTTSTNSGGTAALGMGQDLVALNKSGSGVDFGAGSPLAAMVAATLDVPLSVLLTDGSAGGRQGAESALEGPTIKAMNQRRKAHLASRTRVLRHFGVQGELRWSEVRDTLVHRELQAIGLGQSTGTLHRDEVRALVVRALNVVSDHAVDDLPAEPVSNEPGQDNGGQGPLSDGTNDSRDNAGGPTDA